ncbi:hypothetical protein NK718_08560 [Alsobacter sp. SYSU M60028]|uniref:Lectin-like protein BA14k n=1 Tax=Alsobacter ponti TaxID=2962936 RepID=A0ABT1LAP9_9HYPH|nr:hypothetical protein [Alsobacter ponti]MCP8938564.1 hypothetical protein [Alsobacter ponti]
MIRKFAATTAGALALAASLVGNSAPASAEYGRNAAFFGGLATGAVVGGAIGYAARPYAYGPGYGYGYRPSYYAPGYYAAPVATCWREREPLYDRWGNVASYRTVRVCR